MIGCNGEAEPGQHIATFFFLLGILWVSSLSHPCYCINVLGIHFGLVQMKSYIICFFVIYGTFPVLGVICVVIVFPWLPCSRDCLCGSTRQDFFYAFPCCTCLFCIHSSTGGRLGCQEPKEIWVCKSLLKKKDCWIKRFFEVFFCSFVETPHCSPQQFHLLEPRAYGFFLVPLHPHQYILPEFVCKNGHPNGYATFSHLDFICFTAVGSGLLMCFGHLQHKFGDMSTQVLCSAFCFCAVSVCSWGGVCESVAIREQLVSKVSSSSYLSSHRTYGAGSLALPCELWATLFILALEELFCSL